MTKCNLISVRFTDKENELFCLLKAGYTRKESAEKMFVSTKTIDSHMQSIYAKLGAKGLVEALSFEGEIIVARSQHTKWNENKSTVYKLLKSGLSPKEVAKEMRFGLITIRRWRREFIAEGKLSNHQRTPLFSCLRYFHPQKQDANY